MSEERERVERVGVEVMGWQRMGHVWADGDRYVAEATGLVAWNPFASASDDYMVLERVRETWSLVDRQVFARHVATLLWEPRAKARGYGLLLAYERGDYATAALAIRDAQKQTERRAAT